LFRVKYCFVAESGPVEIANSRQNFDPSTAVLTSSIDAEPFKFNVRSFLTKKHLFVLEFNFQKFPENGEICFALDDNRITYTGKHVNNLSHPMRYSKVGNKLVASFKQAGETGFNGVVVMDVIAQDDVKMEFSNERKKFPYLASGLFLNVKGLKNGSVVYCITCAMDNRDSQDYKKEVFEIIEEFKRKTFKEIYESHIAFWRDYMEKSFISISPDIDFIYYLSLYLLKAVQFPTGAIIPSPVFPNNHGCLVYWDAMFDQMGLLKNNRISEAKKIAKFWLYGLEKAKKNAMSLGFKGAYYGWATDFYGHDHAALSTNQVHFNGDIALCCWKYFEYTGDTQYLKKIFPVMKETIDFLISAYIEDCDGVMRVKSCRSLDESSYDRTGDTWTAAVIIKGIENIIRSANIIGEKIKLETYERIHKRLIEGLEKNCKNGILFSHSNYGRLNVGSILTLTVLDQINGVDYARTFKRFVRDTREKLGSGWGHSSRMRCLIFPWVEMISAIFLAEQCDSNALKHIKKAIRATNSFGGFAEYIWMHGLISRQWYVSAHGTFLWAISEMLAYSDNQRIVLFPGFPDNIIRDGVSFENIVATGNVFISCRVENNRLLTSIVNRADKEVKREVFFREHKITISLCPGKREDFKLKIV
ncbi:MAG: hypothetical protein NC830_06135, partial [Candidatus Omnitrophica bacterium]|nr:hypothetical protein [Candidatus Omnitrophota bacterium]